MMIIVSSGVSGEKLLVGSTRIIMRRYMEAGKYRKFKTDRGRR